MYIKVSQNHKSPVVSIKLDVYSIVYAYDLKDGKLNPLIIELIKFMAMND